MELKSRSFTSKEPHVAREPQVADPWDRRLDEPHRRSGRCGVEKKISYPYLESNSGLSDHCPSLNWLSSPGFWKVIELNLKNKLDMMLQSWAYISSFVEYPYCPSITHTTFIDNIALVTVFFIFLFEYWRVESTLGPLGTAATPGLLYLPRVIVRMEKLTEWTVLAGETEVLRENLPRRHFVHHKSQLPHPGRTRVAAVGSQRLTSSAMARPSYWLLLALK
jgi:hypothetical protein